MKKVMDIDGKEINGTYKKEFLELRSNIETIMEDYKLCICLEALSACLIIMSLESEVSKEELILVIDKGFDLYKRQFDEFKKVNYNCGENK